MPFTSLGVLPNLLVNGDFTINQRAFAFGALADGVYGVDRWKAAGASNVGWNAATLTLTLNAGALSGRWSSPARGDTRASPRSR